MSMDTVERLVNGELPDPDGDQPLTVPTRRVVIADSLAGEEAELVAELDFEPPFVVVSDNNTHMVLGARVEMALASIGTVVNVHLGDRPHPDMDTAEALMTKTAKAGSIIAVGSGTINDLCKYAAARQDKRCAVFATAPSMNGYTSVNASITDRGLKKTLPAVAQDAVFMDLKVLADAPVRMIRSGLGDSVCRPTAQSDWLLSHLLLDGPYRDVPYLLLSDDETALFAEPEALVSGDLEAMARLARTLVLSGFGMTVCGGSHPASQGEHLISHYVEMMAPPDWQGVFHGEQIAVTTCVMARLQERMLNGAPIELKPTMVTKKSIEAHFGSETGASCWAEFDRKRIDTDQADKLNERICECWPSIREAISAIALPAERIQSILTRAGVPVTYDGIGLDRDFFADAVVHSREIRDRYTFLDLAADAGRLDIDSLI